LTVVNIESATASASAALRPKALMTVLRPSTATSVVVTPATPALAATSRKVKALSRGTPALRAW
jgi:hypothetical protein